MSDNRTIIERLYESEINASISWLWDGGYDLKIGDTLNGFAAEGRADTWPEAEAWLSRAAIKKYPESLFAREAEAL